MPVTTFYLLKTRRFLPLFLCQALVLFNDNFFKSALAVFITFTLIHSAREAQVLINFAGALYGLPFLLFSALAGQVADKFNRNRVICSVKFVEIIFMGLGLYGFYSKGLPLLLTILFLIGAHSAFFAPVKYSSLPCLLRKNEILSGTGLLEASAILSVLLGAIAGTLLGSSWHGAMVASSATLVLASLGWLISLLIPPIPLAEPTLKIDLNLYRGARAIFAYAKVRPVILATMLKIAWFIFVSVALVTQFPVYTKSIIHGKQYLVAAFFAVFTLGLALGSLVCNRLSKGLIHSGFVPLSLIGMTLFTLDLALTSESVALAFRGFSANGTHIFLSSWDGWRVVFDLFVIAFCSGIYVVPLYAILQTETESTYRSRMIACNNIFASFFGVLATVSVILLVSLGITIPQLFGLLGIGNGVLAYCLLRARP